MVWSAIVHALYTDVYFVSLSCFYECYVDENDVCMQDVRVFCQVVVSPCSSGGGATRSKVYRQKGGKKKQRVRQKRKV